MSVVRPPEAVLPIPEPPFALGDTGRDLYAATAPVAFADPENGWAWARYLAALTEILDPVSVMVRTDAEGNPGWTSLASPTRCPEPWLRVLAQWAGIRRWDAMSADDLRELIGPRAPGLWRGTRAAMVAAVRRFLPPGTADAFVYFEERADGDPYRLRVFTYSFIEHDPEQVREALLAAKPAGLQLIYEVRRGQTWNMLNTRQGSWAEVNANYDNWAAVMDEAPLDIAPGEDELL